MDGGACSRKVFGSDVISVCDATIGGDGGEVGVWLQGDIVHAEEVEVIDPESGEAMQRYHVSLDDGTAVVSVDCTDLYALYAERQSNFRLRKGMYARVVGSVSPDAGGVLVAATFGQDLS
eukprot:CAMPEP_0169472616 /NCGR_PEP_ID=MMETSP1042-20121227/25260_1 /TAXON_ID=464988 /ORGANISM="Hemiselmis andersenii, Strain CCMP1180" /LENGTH=119 /DNA_ID=CAMNT_0009586475 /DNA_START=177 /DNA_END=533 /DNA_ORIENTATION=-